jgi:hypothetical protein
MAKPKLALIPAAQGSKFYSVLPSDGVGDFDFARASAATRINKYGLIETVASGQSRLNYPLIDGVVNGCPSHLLEPQRINLFTYSEELSNWTNIQNVTVTDNDIVSPDGSQNASRINETTVNNVHRLFLNPTVASAKHTFSVFLKAGTRKWAYLRLDGGTFEPRTWFDLENGVLGTVNSDHIASIEDFGNGWYRCSVTIAGTTYDTTPLGIIAITTGNNVYSYAGDVNEYIYAWGAQLEQGSYPTSYIPTSGTIATRSAETANNSGDASTFNSSEGVLMAEISALDISTTNGWISVSEDANINNNQFNLRFVADSNLIQAVSRAGGLGQDVVLQHTLTDKTTTNKIAIKYKLNDWALWVNGVEVDTENSSNAFTTNSLDVLDFDRGNNSSHFYGNIKQVQYYDSALNDSELEKLSSWTSFSEMATSQLYSIQ